MDRYRLVRDFAPGRAGDEVALVFGVQAVRVQHHEFDPGQAIPWAIDVPYVAVQHLAVAAPYGRMLWVAAGPEDTGEAVMTVRVGRPHGTGLLRLAGDAAALRRARLELLARCGAPGAPEAPPAPGHETAGWSQRIAQSTAPPGRADRLPVLRLVAAHLPTAGFRRGALAERIATAARARRVLQTGEHDAPWR